MKSFQDIPYLNELNELITTGKILEIERNPLEIRKRIVSTISEKDHSYDEYYICREHNDNINEDFTKISRYLNNLNLKYITINKIIETIPNYKYLKFQNSVGKICELKTKGDYISSKYNYFDNSITLSIKLKDFYFEYKCDKNIKIGSNSEIQVYYNHKCKCCLECKGVFEFYGNIDTYCKLIDNNIYKTSLNNCMFNQDYIMLGKYFKTYDNLISNVTYKDNSIYEGIWKNGQPNGYGIATLRRISSNTDNIRARKFYGNWVNGLLDARNNFKIKFYYKKTVNNHYNIGIFNSKLNKSFYFPDFNGEIFYVKNKKLISHYNGKLDASLRNGEGVMTYYDESVDVESYVGEFKDNKYSKGKITFKHPSCYIWFEGLFHNYIPYFGTRKSCNGMIYAGYVNKDYESHGEGTINRENCDENHNCTCGKNAFKEIKAGKNKHILSSMFNEVNGFWNNDKLLFEHEINEKCDNCSNFRTVICMDCEKYFCENCIKKHNETRKMHNRSGKYYKFHSIMKLEYMDEKYGENNFTINTKTQSRKEIIDEISSNITSLDPTLSETESKEINEISKLIVDNTFNLKEQYKDKNGIVNKTIDLKLENGKITMDKEHSKEIIPEKEITTDKYKNDEWLEASSSSSNFKKSLSAKKKKGKKNKQRKKKDKKKIKRLEQKKQLNTTIDKSITDTSETKTKSEKRMDTVIPEVSNIIEPDTSFEQLLLDMKEENGGENEHFLTYKKK